MNTIDLISKISESHNISIGRTEMIFSILVEKIVDKLKREGRLMINDFGEFKVENFEGINRIKFYASGNFQDKVNSL